MTANSERSAQSLSQQAAVLYAGRRFAEALEACEAALALDPAFAHAHHIHSIILRELGRTDEALAACETVIALRPDAPEPLQIRGIILLGKERWAEALASFDAALALRPAYAEAHNGRGLALAELGRRPEALAAHETAIALKPSDADAHYNRGVVLHRLARAAEALASLDQAIAAKPDHPRAWNNRGTALTALGRPAEALESFDRAIALEPRYAEAHANRGVALTDLNRLDEALESYDVAVALDPQAVDARLSRSFALLLAGRYEEGWREYEWRKTAWTPAERRFEQGRPWLGDFDIRGKRLFLHHEQGLGDSLQFVRFLWRLDGLGAEISCSIQAPLRPLLEPLLPGIEWLGEHERPARYDAYCSLMSLPLALGARLETIPAPDRYLLADEGRRRRFEALLGPKRRRRIGLAWSGNPDNPKDRSRTPPFEALAPLLGEDADWIALQNAIRPSDAETFARDGRVRFLGGELRDFADAAALTDLMDLVVSVDTSNAHLAGAMGKPVWILLPFSPDWRWLLGRADSPWYPSARLFRQPAIGDWAGVVEAVRLALTQPSGG